MSKHLSYMPNAKQSKPLFHLSVTFNFQVSFLIFPLSFIIRAHMMQIKPLWWNGIVRVARFFQGKGRFLKQFNPCFESSNVSSLIMKKTCVLLVLLAAFTVFTFKCYYSGVTKHNNKYLSFLYKTPTTSEMIWEGFNIFMETAEEFNLATIVKIVDLYIKLSKSDLFK